MTPDAHTPCPACPMVVRHLYTAGRRVLMVGGYLGVDWTFSPAECQELYLALEALRPFVDAHDANQVHALSPELADARDPTLLESAR